MLIESSNIYFLILKYTYYNESYKILYFTEKDSKEKENKVLEVPKNVKESPSKAKNVIIKTALIDKQKTNKLKKTVMFEEESIKPNSKDISEPKKEQIIGTHPSETELETVKAVAEEESASCEPHLVLAKEEEIVAPSSKKETPKITKKNKQSAAAIQRWKVRREKQALLKLQQEKEKKEEGEVQK